MKSPKRPYHRVAEDLDPALFLHLGHESSCHFMSKIQIRPRYPAKCGPPTGFTLDQGCLE